MEEFGGFREGRLTEGKFLFLVVAGVFDCSNNSSKLRCGIVTTIVVLVCSRTIECRGN